MRVYVVLTGEYEDVYIYGVYATQEDADRACRTPRGNSKRGVWWVEEYVVGEVAR